MMNRTLKPRITKDNFSKWTSGMDSFYDEDPEAKLIKQENQDYRDSIKSEVLEDLYDIILKHKKELRKIPQCSHINGAQEWARKRGLRAIETNIDGDAAGTKEVVVLDKKGKPFVVNGYTLKPSDFPVRNKYWSTHQKESERVKEPMHEWLHKKGGIYDYEEDGMFGKKNIRLTKLGEEISKWDGFRMPTAPKQLASPYSAFSKLIAPLLKASFWHKWIIEKLTINNALDGNETKEILYYPHIWNKIVSPITIYRYLYLKLIDQKFFFGLKYDNDGKLTYAQYKSLMKRDAYKAKFNKWFYDVCLNSSKNGFNPNMVNKALIDQNLINGEYEADCSDPNDGLIQLLGGADNFGDKTTVAYRADDNTPAVFDDIVRNDECAEEFYNILNDKNHEQYRDAKIALAIFKERAQEHVKTKVFSKAGLERMYDSDKAYDTYIKSMNETRGLSPNITEADGVDIYKQAGGQTGSPRKMTEEVQNEEEEE